MSCTGRTLCSLRELKHAGLFALAGGLASAASGAQEPPSLPDYLLPAVPSFQLSLPAVPLPSNQWLWLQQEGSPASGYWRTALVPREWRDARDDELRLELETGRWELGKLSL